MGRRGAWMLARSSESSRRGLFDMLRNVTKALTSEAVREHERSVAANIPCLSLHHLDTGSIHKDGSRGLLLV